MLGLTATASAQVAAPTAPAAAASAPPAAETPASAPSARVEITGERGSDSEQRRRSTAAKIIIGREQIDQYGDATIGEVLRRLSGVGTGGRPGRGGPPRMRGLGGGYTQLLIDGERIPGGFALESLTPEQVERIEILRAPTAETGARAIGGTINIITREGFRKRLNDLRTGFAFENGQWTPGAFWTHSDSAEALTYTLTGSVFRNRRASAEEVHTTSESLADGTPVEDRREFIERLDQRLGLNLGTRLQWRLGEAGDVLLIHPTIFHQERDGSSLATRTQTLPATPARYDLAESQSDGRFTSARLNLQWRQRLADGWRGEANGYTGRWHSRSDSQRQEWRLGEPTPLRRLDDRSDTHETSLKLGAKLTALLGDESRPGQEHNLVSGVEVEAVRRQDSRTLLQDGLPLLVDFGDNLRAESTRWAAFAQNEWSITPNVAAHVGLRWEGIETVGDPGDGSRPSNRSSVWTPLLHGVWKPDPNGRDQVRLSLTRSYRAPPLGALIARPTIASLFPTDGPNEPTHPDRAGNPDLRPELATGIDLAWELYLPGGGLLSANLFHRRIRDLMRGVVALETVSWSAVPRWVSRRRNIGNAQTSGVELEAKGRLDLFWDGAPRVDLSSNLSLYRSKVDGIPGPDNRLDQQAQATLNLGADYRLPGLPLKVGGNLNWVPGYRTQVSAEQAVSVNTRRVADAYALWTISPTLALRLLASNLAPRDSIDSDSLIVGKLRETAWTTAPSYTNWQFRLEFKL